MQVLIIQRDGARQASTGQALSNRGVDFFKVGTNGVAEPIGQRVYTGPYGFLCKLITVPINMVLLFITIVRLASLGAV